MSGSGWVAAGLALLGLTLSVVGLITSNSKPRRKVTCCEHNPCPDRPKPKRKYETTPYRCPQCKTWWVAESYHPSWDWERECKTWEWKKVSEQAGEMFIQDLR